MGIKSLRDNIKQIGGIYKESLLYSLFKDLLTDEELTTIEANPDIMAQINSNEISTKKLFKKLNMSYLTDIPDFSGSGSTAYFSDLFYIPYGGGRLVASYNAAGGSHPYSFVVMDLNGNIIRNFTAFPSALVSGYQARRLLYNNGYLYYCVCGPSYNQIQMYRINPDSGSWTALASSSAISGVYSTKCVGVDGMATDGVNIFIFTNGNNSSSGSSYYTYIHKYNIATNTWTTMWYNFYSGSSTNYEGDLYYDPVSKQMLYGTSSTSNVTFGSTFDPSLAAFTGVGISTDILSRYAYHQMAYQTSAIGYDDALNVSWSWDSYNDTAAPCLFSLHTPETNAVISSLPVLPQGACYHNQKMYFVYQNKLYTLSVM